MRYFTISLLASMVALAGACGYDFETEGDLFECASDDDCVDGFECAGHTSRESDDAPLTFCVESKDAEIAVWQATMPAFQSGCDTQVWDFDWDAWMVVSDNETPPPSTLPPAQAERQSFIDAGGECVGDVSAYGALRIMCRMPKGELVANTAGMWAVLYDVGGDPLVFQNQIAVAFIGAAVDSDTRLAPAPDEIELHHQFDEHLGTDAARCAEAAQRMCPENVALCIGCTVNENCPPHFSCETTTSACVPNPES